MAEGSAGPDASSRSTPLLTAAAVLGAVALLGALWWSGRPQPLNVLLISLDTTRPDHLGAYGAPRPNTPNLDRLAAEGTVFESARTTAPWTLPSHMSLFTGLPPELHGVRYDWNQLPLGRPILGELFAEAGFRTVGLFTAPYVHANFGFARGMDFYERLTKQAMLYDHPRTGLSQEEQNELVARTERQSHLEVTSTDVVNRLQFFLRHNPAEKNLFFLHFFDPHYDYLPPRRHRIATTDPDYAGPITGRDVMLRTDLVRADMPADDLEQLRRLYDAEIRYVDEQIGRVLDVLEERDELEHTLIAVVADHGEAFFEHGTFGHRQDLSEEVLRVPMIFWGPGRVPDGERVEQPVSLVDVLPTLLELAGLPEQPDVYGRSLVPLMQGDGGGEPRRVTALLDFIPRDAEDSYTRYRSLVLGDLKYVRVDQVAWSPQDRADLEGAVDLEARREAVFDLTAADPEAENLLETRPDDPRVVHLREAFEHELQRRAEFARERGWRGGRVGDTDLGHASALGYLGGQDDS